MEVDLIMYRKKRKGKRYGKIGHPKSRKRKLWMKKIRRKR